MAVARIAWGYISKNHHFLSVVVTRAMSFLLLTLALASSHDDSSSTFID